MIFVGSPGMVQIHTGPVTTLKQVGPWFNVLDPGFNLHLRDGDITEAWVVRKPTRDGIVTALEVYDAEGRQIAQMFGERHDGEKELADRRTLMETRTEEHTSELQSLMRISYAVICLTKKRTKKNNA